MNTLIHNQDEDLHEQIAQRANELWEREGRQKGRVLEYWLRAERELLSNRVRPDKTRPVRPATGPTAAPRPRGK